MKIQRILPAVWIVLASLLFATDATIRHRGVGTLDVRVVGLIEHVVALLAVLPFFLWRRIRAPEAERAQKFLPHNQRDWMLFVVIGIGGSALGGSVFSQSMKYIGPSMASMFTMLQPVFVLFFAYYLLRERYSGFFVPCAIWVVANSILMSVADHTFEGVWDDPGFFRGAFLALLSAAIWGGSTVAGRALASRYSPSFVVFWRWIFAVCFLGAVVLSQSEAVQWSVYFTWESMKSLLYLGVFVQTFAYLFYYLGLRHMQASMATFIELIYPLAGVFFATWASGSGFSFLQAFGAANLLIAMGLLLAVEYPKAVR